MPRAYCYARPSHEYWGFGAGTDFESKIVLKRRAAALLRQAFEKRSWQGELVVFSGNTDCYQPVESTHGLTRACLEVCTEYRNPVGIITKGTIPVRDMDLFRQLQERAWIRVYFSIAFADDETARLVEPQAPSISARFETMRVLSEAGILRDIRRADHSRIERRCDSRDIVSCQGGGSDLRDLEPASVAGERRVRLF